MNEINRRIDFDNPDSPVIFMNINLKRFYNCYKYQCLLKDQLGLLNFCVTIDEPELDRLEAECWIEHLTEEAFIYFEELINNE